MEGETMLEGIIMRGRQEGLRHSREAKAPSMQEFAGNTGIRAEWG